MDHANKIRIMRIVLMVLFVMIALSLSTTDLEAQTLTCEQCGNPIRSGNYVTVDGKVYHPEHFLCAYCGNPIGDSQFYKDGGNYYHPDHYAQYIAPRCAFCGEPIIGEYIKSEGKTYHKDHYDKYVALKCSFCGLTINGDYTKTFWGETYHKYHEGNVVKCDYCSRYISQRRATPTRISTSSSSGTYSNTCAIRAPRSKRSAACCARVGSSSSPFRISRAGRRDGRTPRGFVSTCRAICITSRSQRFSGCSGTRASTSCHSTTFHCARIRSVGAAD